MFHNILMSYAINLHDRDECNLLELVLGSLNREL